VTAQGPVRYAAFRVGTGLALVSPSTFALLDTTNGALAERLWALMEEGAGVDSLLEELSATGLRSLGSFALVEVEPDAMRVVVRGEACAEVVSESDTERFTGVGVKTWLEHVVPGGRSFVLALDGELGEPSPYRVTEAVLPAVGLMWPIVRDDSPTLQGLELGHLADFEPGLAIAPPFVPAVVETVAPPVTVTPEAVEVAEAVEVVEVVEVAEFAGHAGDASDDDDFLDGQTVHRSVVVAALAPQPAPAPEPEIPPDPSAPRAPSWDTIIGGVASISNAPPISSVPQISAVPTGAPPAAPQAPDTNVGMKGDHDGMTMSVAQLRAMRAAEGMASLPPVPMGGPTVQALLCPSGHASPPHASFCRVCSAPLTGAPVTIGRPPLGRITMSSGHVIELTRPAIVGRNPKVEGRLPSEVPQTVRIDAGQALSRSHVMIRIEEWQVLVEDLGSANGTTVTLPGRDPRRLHEGEPMLLEHGAHIDLGGEVDGTYDATP
jgi:hypothetical protein